MQKNISQPESRKLLRLAIPIIISAVGNMLMGLVDTIIVGQYSSIELAGVAAGNSLFWAVTVLGIGYLGAMDPIIAQSHGSGNSRRSMDCLIAAMQEAFVFALIATPLLWFLAGKIAWIGAEPSVAMSAQAFLRTQAPALLPILLFQALQRYWQGMEIAIPFTVIILLANVLNYFLALNMVQGGMGFAAMGSAGAALATLVVRICTLFAAIGLCIVLWRQRPELTAELPPLRQLFQSWSTAIHKRLLRLGCPAALQMGLEVFAFSLSTLLIARLGAENLATHQIVLNIISFSFMFPLGLAGAAATRVGYHVGRKDTELALQTAWIALFIVVLMMSSFGVILYFAPEYLLQFFTKDPAVILLGSSIIILCALVQIFDGVQVVTSGILRGFGDTRTALFTNLLAHWCLGLPLGLLLCFGLDKGLWGLWLGLTFGLFITAILNSIIIIRRPSESWLQNSEQQSLTT